MGAVPSIFALWERKTNSEENLRKVILQYLMSDDYSFDPYQYIQEISALGYSTLEQFIESIPPSDATDEVLYQYYNIPVPQLGMRYIVASDPGKRGTLAERIVELKDEKLATLRLDQAIVQQSYLARGFYFLTYIMSYPAVFLFQKFKGQQMVQNAGHHCTYSFQDLIPEKVHLRAYLQIAKLPIQTNETTVLHQSASIRDSEISRKVEPHPSIVKYIGDKEKGFIENELEGSTKRKRKKNKKQSNASKQLVLQTENTRLPTNVKPEQPLVSPLENPLIGTHKGIEGAHNSCYMDALLVSMFYCTNNFDFLLTKKTTDSIFARKTRRRLAKVVRLLRENYYCDYETLWELRTHLSLKNEDLLGAFMDAEQVLYLLCDEVLNEAQFIHYDGVDNDDWGDYMHLMSIDPSDTSKIITVQRNMEVSFAFNGNIRMASVPNPALILGMPRSNRVLIHYDAVIPNANLQIHDLMQNAPCKYCENKAIWEVQPDIDSHENHTISNVLICTLCLDASGKHDAELKKAALQQRIVSRTTMKLSSIVCIRGAHFVAFIRKNAGNLSTKKSEENWNFFDSMAGGYPEVKVVPKLEEYLDTLANEPDQFYTSKIPPLVKRSMTDGHLCIYEPVYYNEGK